MAHAEAKIPIQAIRLFPSNKLLKSNKVILYTARPRANNINMVRSVLFMFNLTEIIR